MKRNSLDKFVRWLCAILFSAFAFCWLYFLQQDLLQAAASLLVSDNEVLSELLLRSQIVLPLCLTLVALLLALLGRLILRFKKGLYACNYILSAAFLGVVTGYDGTLILGQSYREWVVTIVFIVILLLVCKIVSSIPKSDYIERPRTIAGNFFIMTLLFCMVGYLGNTDENLHRRLRMERLFNQGEYAELLEVGCNEEESDKSIDLLRAKAILSFSSDTNKLGGGIGDLLFSYSISDPDALSESLKSMNEAQAYLASCLLDCDLKSFSDSIDIDAYQVMPKYYMQALVLAADKNAQEKFQQQFKDEQSLYASFLEALEPLENEPRQFRANSTYIDYHNTYYWFYTFRK